MFSIEEGVLVANYTDVMVWVDFAVSLIIAIIFFVLALKAVKRKFAIIYLIVCNVFLFAAWLFNLTLLWTLTLAALVVGLIIFFYVNISEVRAVLSNSLKLKRSFKKKEITRVYDRRALYNRVCDAALALSKQKIGAIITFERSFSLNEAIKNGTVLNAPVTQELILTIFYPGTRLHDGAIVIRRDLIVAASVYFTPTTKALRGKYGSRHRAAIGVSEISDAVTIIVSEETGRISLTVGGELIPCTPDNLLTTLEEYMFAKVKDEEDEKEDE